MAKVKKAYNYNRGTVLEKKFSGYIYIFKRMAMKKSISPFTFIFRKHSSIFHILELGALCICEKKSLLITKNVNDDIINDI